jgi:cytochrome c2
MVFVGLSRRRDRVTERPPTPHGGRRRRRSQALHRPDAGWQWGGCYGRAEFAQDLYLCGCYPSRSMARNAKWALLLGLLVPGFERVDAADGQRVYRETCAQCHGGPYAAGLSLHGVVGRKAGTLPGYSYSKALKESGIVWTPAKLDAWLTNPHALAPRGGNAVQGPARLSGPPSGYRVPEDALM